jgi:hypothetical protein
MFIIPRPTKFNHCPLAADYPILLKHWPEFEDEIGSADLDRLTPPEHPAHGLILIYGDPP